MTRDPRQQRGLATHPPSAHGHVAGDPVTTPAPPTGEHPARPYATACDLILAHGDHVALGTSSFTIPRGATTAIIGPNGSGKSTLLDALAGLGTPRGGRLTVNCPVARRAYVVQTTQVPEGVPMTVRQIVMMGRYPVLGLFRRPSARDKAAVVEAMERLGVTALAHRHLTELSGGQRQRVIVAQSLAQEHDLLLLDEPVTGLDIGSAETISHIIREETEAGRTVVTTTHDLESARAADYVLLLNGQVLAAGPPETVLAGDQLTEAFGPLRPIV